MGAVAVNAIRSIGYEGAGTLEFLLDRDEKFYFMEMNTRLQVEHPVTEAITGLDLVELQLRVAGGEPLGITQDDVRFSGHAIEVRLCAEDAAHDFMPQSGRMALWRTPAELRVEHALQSGSEIPPFYDSMIAKFVSHGATRDAARRKLIHGIDHTVALGRHHQSGVPGIVPAASGLRGRRSDHRFHRAASRAIADAALSRRHARSGAGGFAALCHRPSCAAMAEGPQPCRHLSASAAVRPRWADPGTRDRS